MDDKPSPASLVARAGSIPAEVGSTSLSPTGANPSTFEVDQFKTYLNQLVPVLLGQDNIESLFLDDLFDSVATRFATDPNQAVVYVVKERDQLETADGKLELQKQLTLHDSLPCLTGQGRTTSCLPVSATRSAQS